MNDSPHSDHGVLRIDPRQPGADAMMMRTPDAWPLPLLPLVRRTDGSQTTEEGVMFATTHLPRTRVYKLNMMDRRTDQLIAGFDLGELDVEYEDYESFEAIIEAGWAVN